MEYLILICIYLLFLYRIDNGDVIQNALLELTGRRTVPNVFINGNTIGGGDDTVEKVNNGEIKKLLGMN